MRRRIAWQAPRDITGRRIATCLMPFGLRKTCSCDACPLVHTPDIKSWKPRCHHRPDKKGPIGGSEFPCQLCDSTVVAHNRHRAVTAFESLAAHGFHMHPTPGGKWPVSPVRGFMETLCKVEIGNLAGNCISLPSAWAVFLYLISNTARRQVLATQPALTDTLYVDNYLDDEDLD